jgi:DNA-binding response OmpR family regulator
MCRDGGYMEQTILIIEDDPLSARLADLVLRSKGHEVTIAPNGSQGLDLAFATPPDLVVLDLMLPDIDGYEILRQLRDDSRTADVRIAVVSAKSQPSDKKMAMQLGADAYLTKPYRKARLLKIADALLAGERVQSDDGE